ncbi:MAG: DUF4058 family protein [Planctomycetes bacterium]|nr:DUF4058 family protein [Planctomycetota bacterium]
MSSPFPGMDPYLEDPEIWPDVHHRLAVAVADSLAPLLGPRYVVRVVRRTFELEGDDLVLLGIPDVAVQSAPRGAGGARPPVRGGGLGAPSRSGSGVLEVKLPMSLEVSESYLEVRRCPGGRVVTAIELLSPTNKLTLKGRAQYLGKREEVLKSRTHLVEVDLLRAGRRMPVGSKVPESDYRILVSRAEKRPLADLHLFGVRDLLPALRVPLLSAGEEVEVSLNALLHGVYERASYDREIDYTKAPLPPLRPADAGWAEERVRSWRRSRMPRPVPSCSTTAGTPAGRRARRRSTHRRRRPAAGAR